MGENTCKSYIWFKKIVFGIYKELLQLINKKTTHSFRNSAKDLNTYFSKEDIQMALSTWEDTRYH